jgi:hypothetical protein
VCVCVCVCTEQKQFFATFYELESEVNLRGWLKQRETGYYRISQIREMNCTVLRVQ